MNRDVMNRQTAPSTAPARPGVRLYRVRVTDRRQLSPNMIRVSLGGDDLRDFVAVGPDQRVKLILPRDGETSPNVSPDMTPKDILALPESDRPVMRTYTIRLHRADDNEVDIDFATHGPGGGPASAWAQTCDPGSEVALFGPISAYAPSEMSVAQLIAGDETALPAIGAILEQLPPEAHADVVVEIPTAADAQEIRSDATVRTRWLARDEAGARPGELLPDALASMARDRTYGYAWLACESSTAQRLRRHVVEDLGLDKGQVYFSGYWKIGHVLG
ncbi:siderophore-interacting protein [Streptomyces sp. SID6673]|nr:siderophore-interacting protein [Streptomyces sp. SID11726]NEB26361.1 siderophore-interacting protein [Streptomyces sp. SID6673]